MIISDRYKYLFLELPLTGSTAISAELIENYDGRSIYYKHANYRKFSKSASPDEKAYFKFIGIRNPMDMAVSHYHKYLSNPRGKFNGIERRLDYKSPISHYWNQLKHQRKFKYVQSEKPDFSTYFMKFYNTVYTSWSSLDREKMDGFIRFEHLQEDFSQILEALKVDQVRPLPQKNKTKGRNEDFYSFYEGQESRERAAKVFGPYMKEWGYTFPEDWEVDHLMEERRGAYQRSLAIKRPYWILTGR